MSETESKMSEEIGDDLTPDIVETDVDDIAGGRSMPSSPRGGYGNGYN
jgi:hypothetical protein